VNGPTNFQINLRAGIAEELLDMLDPFPFGERRLDGDVEDYITERAEEAPARAPLAIAIHLPAASTEVARSLPQTVHRHFARLAERRASELSRLFALGRRMLLIGLLVLGACLLAGQSLVSLFPNSRIAEVAMEGFIILGWVANWRPMEIFLFDWWPLTQERRLYARLAQAPVTVVAPD